MLVLTKTTHFSLGSGQYTLVIIALTICCLFMCVVVVVLVDFFVTAVTIRGGTQFDSFLYHTQSNFPYTCNYLPDYFT
jgi:hypothetical protein